MNQGRQQIQDRHNSQIKSRPEFQVGDMVWVMKPKSIRGHKTQTFWVWPTTIISRSGQNSFAIITKEGNSKEVHVAQLKPFYDDVLEGGVRSIFIAPTIENQHRQPPW